MTHTKFSLHEKRNMHLPKVPAVTSSKAECKKSLALCHNRKFNVMSSKNHQLQLHFPDINCVDDYPLYKCCKGFHYNS